MAQYFTAAVGTALKVTSAASSTPPVTVLLVRVCGVPTTWDESVLKNSSLPRVGA